MMMMMQSKFTGTTRISTCSRCILYYTSIIAFLIVVFDCNTNYSGNYYVSGEVIRKNNLDYFDVETMKFFIDPYSVEIDYDELDDTDDSNSNSKSNKNQKTITNYDVIILFYAQWCKNCHSLAPSYDKVASTIQAGTNKQSNVIMGLFDCEATIQHSTICTTINIQHYPTIYYISLSTIPRINPNPTRNNNVVTTQSKTKRNTNKPPKHFTLFTGNWQYGEMILYDWIISMRSISYYYNSQFRSSTNIIGNLVSKLFTSNKKKDTNNNLGSFLGMNNNKDKSSTTIKKKSTKKKNRGLPIGIPGMSSSTTGSTNAGTTGSTTGTTTSADNTGNTISIIEYNKLKKQYDASQKIESRYTIIIDSMLTPSIIPEVNGSSSTSNNIHRNSTLAIQVQSSTTNITPKVYVDMFTYMNVTNVWTSVLSNTTTTTSTSNNDDLDNKVVFTCIIDLSYDYCTRMNNVYMYQWINKNPTITDITDTVYEQYNVERIHYLQSIEPYCTIIDECIGTNFQNNTNNCRPFTCPFYDDTACRYLTSCLSDDLYNLYNTAYIQQQQQKQQKQKQQQQQQNSIPVTKSTTTFTGNSFGTNKNDIQPPPPLPKKQSTYTTTTTTTAGDVDGNSFGSLKNSTNTATTATTATTTGTSAKDEQSISTSSSKSTSNNKKWGLR